MKLINEGEYVLRPFVVVDAGHGGAQSGNPNSHLAAKPEKTINLAVANYLRDILYPRVHPLMIRTTDLTVDNRQRVIVSDGNLYARIQDFAFVSIHCDAPADGHPNPTAPCGFTVFYPNGGRDDFGRKLEAAMAAAYLELGMASDREVTLKPANYTVLDAGKNPHTLIIPGRTQAFEADAPAALVELGFLSNPIQAGQLTDSNIQKALARAVANGINDFFGTDARTVLLSGRVKLTTGPAVPFAKIQPSAYGTAMSPRIASRDGSFSIVLPHSGLWSIGFLGLKGVCLGKRITLNLDFQRVGIGDVYLTPDNIAGGASIAGFVFNQQGGDFLENITVTASQGVAHVDESSEANGGFYLNCPKPGAWNLSFEDPADIYKPLSMTVTLKANENKNIGMVYMKRKG